jgi:hypothetical protein
MAARGTTRAARWPEGRATAFTERERRAIAAAMAAGGGGAARPCGGWRGAGEEERERLKAGPGRLRGGPQLLERGCVAVGGYEGMGRGAGWRRGREGGWPAPAGTALISDSWSTVRPSGGTSHYSGNEVCRPGAITGPPHGRRGASRRGAPRRPAHARRPPRGAAAPPTRPAGGARRRRTAAGGAAHAPPGRALSAFLCGKGFGGAPFPTQPLRCSGDNGMISGLKGHPLGYPAGVSAGAGKLPGAGAQVAAGAEGGGAHGAGQVAARAGQVAARGEGPGPTGPPNPHSPPPEERSSARSGKRGQWARGKPPGRGARPPNHTRATSSPLGWRGRMGSGKPAKRGVAISAHSTGWAAAGARGQGGRLGQIIAGDLTERFNGPVGRSKAIPGCAMIAGYWGRSVRGG